jgi:hypothetical protein
MEIYKKIDALHLKLRCNIQEFEGGAGLPTSYSDRLAEEINLLLHGCGLFDLKACWLIALNGTDAGIFLQGMVTSDVLQLEIGQIPEYGYLVAGVIDNGNFNGKFDPGENILLLIYIENQGTVNGQNINVVVQPQGANAIYIQNVDSPQIIGSLEADASTQQEIAFDIS